MHIAVTGVGIVSALGVGKKVTLDALRTGRSGIVAAPTHFATRNRLPVGEVALDNAQLQQLLGLSGCHSRTALLGILAASEALQDAGASRPRTALVSATSVGGMDLTEQFFPQFMQDDRSGRLRQVVHHDCADSTISIARYCGIDGFVTTISTACSSAANALMLAVRLLRHGVADRVVAGGTDSLCRFTLNGFKSLMILDSAPCRPFDESRAGLNLGEGAAYLVLERAEDAAGEPYCFLDGFANAIVLVMPFLSVFVFIGTSLTEGYDMAEPLTVTQVGGSMFYSMMLFLVLLFSVVTGWGRQYEGENGEPLNRK